MRRKEQKQINPSKLNRVLVVRLDEIGDVVITTPFLRELRRNLPNAWITLAVKPEVHNLVELCPYVNEVVTYDWDTRGRFSKLQRHGRAFRLAWRHLLWRRFDLAILPRWDIDIYHGSFVTYFSGARWRVSYSETISARKKCLNNGFDQLFTHVLSDDNVKHEVEHNLDVIRFLGWQVQGKRLELWDNEQDQAFAEEFLNAHQVKADDLLITLSIGARAARRVWPIDRFADLALWLRNFYGARLIVVGDSREQPLGETLERALGSWVVNAVGRTTLRQSTALLKRCRLFVGNDTGPMHIAAAVGLPLIELSCHSRSGDSHGPNSPLRFGPWGVKHMLIQPSMHQSPCVDRCIADRPHCILSITVEQLKNTIVEHLPRLLVTEGAKATSLTGIG